MCFVCFVTEARTAAPPDNEFIQGFMMALNGVDTIGRVEAETEVYSSLCIVHRAVWDANAKARDENIARIEAERRSADGASN